MIVNKKRINTISSDQHFFNEEVDAILFWKKGKKFKIFNEINKPF